MDSAHENAMCRKCRFCRFQTDKTTLPTCYLIKNCALIFREIWSCGKFLRTFWGCPKMCSQEVRRKNAHGVNLLIFNITNLIFLIRFLRFFRFSRICLTPKFSKYSKDSNWLLITHHSDLFPRYHPVTTLKGYRKDTEGISKGYESHTNLIVIS